MTLDENNLARQLRAGEAGSFETLYREYGPRIYRFCRRLTCNDTSAEDLTQDVFLAAYRGMERFEGRSSLATWLYRITLYRWRNLQNAHSVETLALDETTTALSSDPAQTGLERIALENALSALPAPLREAFLLVKGEGFLCREAAEILGIPEGTLKSRVYSAILKLQGLLEPHESLTPQKQSGHVIPPKELLQ
jgi:RNA polymerase sigma-70 factor (ECF subfamily)